LESLATSAVYSRISPLRSAPGSAAAAVTRASSPLGFAGSERKSSRGAGGVGAGDDAAAGSATAAPRAYSQYPAPPARHKTATVAMVALSRLLIIFARPYLETKHRLPQVHRTIPFRTAHRGAARFEPRQLPAYQNTSPLFTSARVNCRDRPVGPAGT